MHLNSPRVGASNPARPDKIVSAAEAARLVHDGDTVATGGFVGIGFAEEIAIALEEAFCPPTSRRRRLSPARAG